MLIIPGIAISADYFDDAVAARDAGNTADARVLFKQACESGDTKGCYSGGVMFDFGTGGTKDIATARSLYSIDCDGGDGNACNNLAAKYNKGNGVPLDKSKARLLFQRACENGAIGSCYHFANMAYNGEGGPRDLPEAGKFTRKACKADVEPACDLASKIKADLCIDVIDEVRCLANAIEREIDKLQKEEADDPEKAKLERFNGAQEKCGAGDAHSCYQLAKYYEKGEGVEVDLIKAKSFYEKACAGNDDLGCVSLAVKLIGDATGGQDRARADALFIKYCNSSTSPICYPFAQKLIQPGVHPDNRNKADYDRALLIFDAACSNGAPIGCRAMGFENENGWRKDMAKAMSYYQQGCKKGNEFSCDRLQQLQQ